MFSWIARRLSFLKPVPGLPQMLDGLLYAHSALFNREVLMSLDTIEKTLLSWPGVTSTGHRFGGTEFRLGRREIGHVHSNGLLDIPFTKSLRDQAIDAGKAQPHHIFPNSGWISFWIKSDADLANALELLRLNFDRWQALDEKTHE